MSFVNTKFPKSPAITKREIDFTQIVSNELSEAAAYVGFYPWGPACKIVSVPSSGVQTSTFGKPENWNYLHHFAVEDYLAYAAPVQVVRAIDEYTFNAFSSTNGTDLAVTAQVVNGEVVGVTYVAQGSGYAAGDILPLEVAHETVSQAFLRVLRVDSDGAVLEVEVLEGGKGYIQEDAMTVGDLKIQIKNDDDFMIKIQAGCQGQLENTTGINRMFSTVIAKYPGSYGNSLLASFARASEFDNWEYASLFGVAPAASVAEFAILAGQNAVNIGTGLISDWASDWVVTLDGNTIVEGVAPGTYAKNALTGELTLNIETEPFSGTGADFEFTLANVFGIPTTNAIVKVNGAIVPQWTGSGVVPSGYSRVNGNQVTMGVSTARTSGDGINSVFQANFGTQIVTAADAQVFVSGTAKTVITSGAPAVGEVLVSTSVIGGNNILHMTFNSADLPPNGTSNIVASSNYLSATDTLEVSYNYPDAGVLKIFADQTEMHAVVVDTLGKHGSGELNEVLEAYSFLSLVPGTKAYDGSLTYYKDAINKQSNFIWVSNDVLTFTSYQLSHGTDSTLGTNAELIAGWEFFKDPDTAKMTYLIGGPADTELANWLIDNILECRCDTLGAFSPSFSDVVCNDRNAVNNAILWRKGIHSTSYAVTEGNWKLRYDQYHDVYRWLPLSQDTLGIIAQSNRENGVWISPAGLERGRYKNYVRLAYNPTRAQRDLLYPNDINPVYIAENVGAVLFGDRTLIGRNSAFRQIGVRMLFIKVEYDMAVASKTFLFELNDEFTRRRAFNSYNPYLRNLLGQGAMDDYRLIVDESNNDAQVINNQFMCVDVLIRPKYSINYICLNFTNVRHGLSFDEVVESQRLIR